MAELIRTLESDEAYYETNPRGLAGLHWQQTGESRNPYKRGSIESLEYIDAFQKLMFHVEQSP